MSRDRRSEPGAHVEVGVLPDLQLRAPRPATKGRRDAAAAGRASERLAFLDGLRGIAALSVVVYHAAVVAGHDLGAAVAPFFNLGNFGVVLFFICSGFVIPLSLEREGSLRTFWIRRIARLYPLYWISVALYAAIGLGLGRGESVAALLANPLAVILANLTMFQTLLGQPHLNYGYWTLLFEMFFYLLASALFVAGLMRRTALVAGAMCLAAIVVEAALPLLLGTAKPVLGIVGFLAAMFLGTALYRVHTGEMSRRAAAALLALGALMLVGTALTVPTSEQGLWGYADQITARAAALGVFVGAFAARTYRTLALLRYLGQISYSAYLLHIAVIALVWLDDPLLNMAAWLIGTLLLATLSYFCIERPAMRLGRRLTKRGGSKTLP